MSDPVDSDRNREHDLEPEWDPSVHRLPVWATIREAVQAIAKEWKALLQAIAVPTLAFVALDVAGEREYVEAVFPDMRSFLQDFLQDVLPWLLSIVPLTLIAVSCHRLVILGVDSLPNAWGLYWSKREGSFLGTIIVIYFVSFLPLLPLVLLIQAVPLFTSTLDEWLLRGILFPLTLYVIARLSLDLPATAIGQGLTVWDRWRLSRSNGWRLALVLSPAALAWVLSDLLLNESLVPSGITRHVLAAFTVVLVWVFGIALLSKAYSWFTGESEAPTSS